jgi:hypothetical protein
MKSPEVLSPNSGPKPESDGKLSSLNSPVPKTKSRRKQETLTDPSTSGSESLTPKKKSDQENESSLPLKQGKSSSLPVPKPLPKPVDRAQQALKRLGVDVQLLRSAPEITPLLKHAEGGLKAVLAAMRHSSDPSITLFLEKYDSIPSGDREKLPWEAIALAAEVNLQQLGWASISAVEQYSAGVTKMLLVSSQPKIMKARIKYGLLPSGEKDRTAAQMASGVIPSPKGPTFIGKAVFGSGKQTMSAQGAGQGDDDDDLVINGDDDPDLDTLFPPSNEMQTKLIPIRQRLLESNK